MANTHKLSEKKKLMRTVPTALFVFTERKLNCPLETHIHFLTLEIKTVKSIFFFRSVLQSRSQTQSLESVTSHVLRYGSSRSRCGGMRDQPND